MTDELLPPGPPDPEDGGGPDVPTDPVEEPEERDTTTDDVPLGDQR